MALWSPPAGEDVDGPKTVCVYVRCVLVFFGVQQGLRDCCEFSSVVGANFGSHVVRCVVICDNRT